MDSFDGEISVYESRRVRAIDRIVEVLRSQFDNFYKGGPSESHEEQTKNLSQLIEECNKLKTDSDLKDTEIVTGLLSTLEDNNLPWLLWTPRFSEIVLIHAGLK